MTDIKGIEKHIKQLSNKSEALSLKISNLESERNEVVSQIKKLNKQLSEARRSTIEYHKGDLLLTYKTDFWFHDNICTVYEILGEIQAESTRTRTKVMKICLHACDYDILTNIAYDGYRDIIDFEQDKEIYYLKSSALSDLLMAFHDLSVTGIPSGTAYYTNKYISEKIQEVIDRHEGKKLVDVIKKSKEYKKDKDE